LKFFLKIIIRDKRQEYLTGMDRDRQDSMIADHTTGMMDFVLLMPDNIIHPVIFQIE